MALLSDKALADHIQVNGTKAYFLNSEGVDIDVTMTAQLVAKYNQKLLQSQSEGTLSTSSKNMYEMGEQIGLTTKLIHIRAPKNESKNGWSQFLTGTMIGSATVLLGLIAFYAKNKV